MCVDGLWNLILSNQLDCKLSALNIRNSLHDKVTVVLNGVLYFRDPLRFHQAGVPLVGNLLGGPEF